MHFSLMSASLIAMCALLWFRPSVNLGLVVQINILTEMIVALVALLGSIVDLHKSPKHRHVKHR